MIEEVVEELNEAEMFILESNFKRLSKYNI